MRLFNLLNDCDAVAISVNAPAAVRMRGAS